MITRDFGCTRRGNDSPELLAASIAFLSAASQKAVSLIVQRIHIGLLVNAGESRIQTAWKIDEFKLIRDFHAVAIGVDPIPLVTVFIGKILEKQGVRQIGKPLIKLLKGLLSSRSGTG